MLNSTHHRSGLPVPWGDLAGRRIFLTGCTGFFGCNLLEAYTRAWERFKLGGQVSVLTRDSARFRVKAPHLAAHPGIEVLEGDLKHSDFGDSSWDFVIHAAVASGEPLDILEGNLVAMRRVLDLAHSSRVRRVLFTSSGAVYGPEPPGLSHRDEEHGGAPPLEGSGAYGEAKRASELLGLLHDERHGHDFLIAWRFAFLGSWRPLEGNFTAGNLIGDGLVGRPIQVNGDGRPPPGPTLTPRNSPIGSGRPSREVFMDDSITWVQVRGSPPKI